MIGFAEAANLLADIRARGIRLHLAGDHLRYEAPLGEMTPELRSAIVDAKPALLRLLTLPSDVPQHLLAVREARDRLLRQGGRFLLVSRIDREVNIGAYTVARCLDALDALAGAITPVDATVCEAFGEVSEALEPCPSCGGWDCWVSPAGGRVCRVCHPPAPGTEEPDRFAG